MGTKVWRVWIGSWAIFTLIWFYFSQQMAIKSIWVVPVAGVVFFIICYSIRYAEKLGEKIGEKWAKQRLLEKKKKMV